MTTAPNGSRKIKRTHQTALFSTHQQGAHHATPKINSTTTINWNVSVHESWEPEISVGFHCPLNQNLPFYFHPWKLIQNKLINTENKYINKAIYLFKLCSLGYSEWNYWAAAQLQFSFIVDQFSASLVFCYPFWSTSNR